jgi:hypothetical protein
MLTLWFFSITPRFLGFYGISVSLDKIKLFFIILELHKYKTKKVHHSFLENMRYGIHSRRLKPAAIYG